MQAKMLNITFHITHYFESLYKKVSSLIFSQLSNSAKNSISETLINKCSLNEKPVTCFSAFLSINFQFVSRKKVVEMILMVLFFIKVYKVSNPLETAKCNEIYHVPVPAAESAGSYMPHNCTFSGRESYFPRQENYSYKALI